MTTHPEIDTAITTPDNLPDTHPGASRAMSDDNAGHRIDATIHETMRTSTAERAEDTV